MKKMPKARSCIMEGRWRRVRDVTTDLTWERAGRKRQARQALTSTTESTPSSRHGRSSCTEEVTRAFVVRHRIDNISSALADWEDNAPRHTIIQSVRLLALPVGEEHAFDILLGLCCYEWKSMTSRGRALFSRLPSPTPQQKVAIVRALFDHHDT